MFGFFNRGDRVIWPPQQRDLMADISSVGPSSGCSDEGPTFETSALEFIFGGQITLSILLIKLNI